MEKSLKVGAMCAGYGGLELGLQYAGFNFQLEWVAESDKWASVVLEERFGVENLGDITKIQDPPAVDVCIAGFPCQPVSQAGSQRGINDERWLIDDVVRVANAAGARWLFLENVLGIYTANEGNAFGQVLASLAKGGYDARWTNMRADHSCGAPHRRNRWFCIAYKGDGEQSVESESFFFKSRELIENLIPSSESEKCSKGFVSDSDGGSYDSERRGQRERLFGAEAFGEVEGEEREWVRVVSSDGGEDVADSDCSGGEAWGDAGCDGGWSRVESVGSSSFTSNSANVGYEWSGEAGRGRGGFADGGVASVAYSNESGSQGQESEERRFVSTRGYRAACDWGQYEEAVRRWEYCLGVYAPEPSEPSVTKTGEPSSRLHVPFVEWMMGLPAGWVSGVEMARTHKLKLLGNGVVPQQAAVAYLTLLGVLDES
jgi:DNA (cytosine-5)-methyltransferase 1